MVDDGETINVTSMFYHNMMGMSRRRKGEQEVPTLSDSQNFPRNADVDKMLIGEERQPRLKRGGTR